jgi:hypothetical protein
VGNLCPRASRPDRPAARLAQHHLSGVRPARQRRRPLAPECRLQAPGQGRALPPQWPRVPPGRRSLPQDVAGPGQHQLPLHRGIAAASAVGPTVRMVPRLTAIERAVRASARRRGTPRAGLRCLGRPHQAGLRAVVA